MSVSCLIGLISGLLQFVVACYALRVSRRFGVLRVGWPFFAAFSLLALAHVLQTFHPLDIEIGFGMSTNVFYEIVSVLLLASIAQAELLVWKRGHNPKVTPDTASAAEVKFEARLAAERETWNQATAELQETVTKLRVEVAQQLEAHEQTKASFQDQLTASQQQYEDARALVAASQEQLNAAQTQLAASEQQVAASQQQLKTVQDQLAAVSESERDLHRSLIQAQTEGAQHKEILQRAKDAFQEAQNKLENAHRKKLEELEQTHWHQLIAGRQSEETLRQSIAGLEAGIAEQKQKCEQQDQKYEQSENACRDLLAILRQSGLTEVATLSQSKVTHLGRIAKVIRDHKKDLGRFIKSDPQGRQLPDSLSVIVEYLSDEQFLLLKKIGSVKKKIEQLESALNLQSKTGEDAAVHDSGKSGELHPHLIGDVTLTGTETAGAVIAPATPRETTAVPPAKAKVVSRT